MTDANEAAKEEAIKIPDVLPVLPLKDLVIFPFIIVPLSVSREKSINAVDQALAENRVIMLTAQKDFQNEDPGEEDLYRVGTVAIIMRMLKLPDGRIRILVQGLSRARIDYFIQTAPFLKAKITRIEEPVTKERGLEVEALIRAVKQNLDRAVSLGKNISPEVMVIAANLDDPARLTDLAASNLDLKLEEAQSILETMDPVERLKKVNEMLTREINLLTMQQEISSAAQGEMNKSQREYFLRQQLKAIQSELGEGEELAEEVENYRKKIEEKSITAEARDEVEKQIKRLERTHPDSAETSIIRTYLDWMTGLPWGVMSADNHDLQRARTILDEDHYDLEKIKERILEYLAVRKLRGQKMKGPILCFVGPPGVGKTSLGRSIARALDRKFVRISLGGVRDEAEIRGHRRTYVGALPGRIIQGINQAGTSNPVFMLDEVDKIGADYRGDPSSALLEVLDPEQNFSFRDHYLGVPYDLSNVMFIVTANVLDTIQPAFLDRMEVIRLSGYTDEEKLAIAKQHLIPKQMEENGIKEIAVVWTDAGITKVITGYTKEAGLRNLEREIGTICRKIAVQVAEGKTQETYRITDGNVEKFLGPMRHFARGAAGTRSGRRGHRTGLDRGRRRHPLHRSDGRARQGQALTDRTARRRDEGIGTGGADLRPRPRRRAGHRTRLLRDPRHPHPRARRRDPEGRAVGRCHDHDGHRLGPDRPSGAPQRGHDRRDHAARRRPADRRRQGEGARGARGEDQHGDPAEAERARPDRRAGADQAGHAVPLRRAHRGRAEDRAPRPLGRRAEDHRARRPRVETASHSGAGGGAGSAGRRFDRFVNSCHPEHSNHAGATPKRRNVRSFPLSPPQRGEGRGEGSCSRPQGDPSSAFGTFSPLRRGEGQRTPEPA